MCTIYKYNYTIIHYIMYSYHTAGSYNKYTLIIKCIDFQMILKRIPFNQKF